MNDWLLIAGDFTPLGGMDRANHALARGLAARGHRVSLVTHRAWDDLHGLVETSRVPRPRGSHLLGSPLLASAGARAARAARGRVVVNGGNALARDVTWIHYLHAAHAPANLSRARTAAHRYYLRRERTAIRAARFVVCNSRRTARDVASAYEVPPDRLRTVYYGSDPSAFAPVVDPDARTEARRRVGWTGGGFRALFVGALGDSRKGFDRLFEAWQALSADPAWDVDLAVAGTGRELGTWQARARVTGLTSIRFLGFRDDIATVMAASDVIVHPSRYEAYGLGVHEAICRGLPAIVSASAGVAERIDGPLRSLLVQDPESAAEIASRLRDWRGGLEAYRNAAASLGETLRQRTWDDMVGDFVAAVA